MAILALGGGVTDIRGSVAGNTFSRNAGGNYMRARVKPVNPRSALQTTRRANAAYLMTCWSKTLEEQERLDWRAYAAATTWTNRLGQVITVNGLAAFLRLNSLLLAIDEPISEAAPTAMGHAGGVAFTFLAENDTSKIQLAEPTGSFDKTVPGDILILSEGLPSECGRNATPKGFRIIGHVEGADPVPPTFPAELDSAYTMQEGQLITCSAMFVDSSFRVSGPTWASVLASPSS